MLKVLVSNISKNFRENTRMFENNITMHDLLFLSTFCYFYQVSADLNKSMTEIQPTEYFKLWKEKTFAISIILRLFVIVITLQA